MRHSAARACAGTAVGVLVLVGLVGCGGDNADRDAGSAVASDAASIGATSTASPTQKLTAAKGRDDPQASASQNPGAPASSAPVSTADDLPTRGVDGTQDSVLENLPGPRTKKCVDVDKNRDVRSGSMAAGPFDDLLSTYEEGSPTTQEIRLYFIPEQSAEMPGIHVRLRNLATNKTVVVRQKHWADAGDFRFYDVQTGLPTDGTWQITAQAGSDRGCWNVRLG